jgi:hypothetical protein
MQGIFFNINLNYTCIYITNYRIIMKYSNIIMEFFFLLLMIDNRPQYTCVIINI